MLPRQYQFAMLVVLLVSVPTLQQGEPFPLENPGWDGQFALQMRDTAGKYTMTTDRKLPLLKTLAEYLGTKPEDIEAIQNHPTVGNYELKVLNRSHQQIQVTIETLAGKITDVLQPETTSELAWLDGRKFFVSRITWFSNVMGIERESLMDLDNMGKDGIGFTMKLRKDIAEWRYNIPYQGTAMYIKYKRS